MLLYSTESIVRKPPTSVATLVVEYASI